MFNPISAERVERKRQGLECALCAEKPLGKITGEFLCHNHFADRLDEMDREKAEADEREYWRIAAQESRKD